MKLIISILFIGLLNNSFSQEVTKATRQNWAGGVCCISGTNFHVTLVFKKNPKEIHVEDVWVHGNGKLVGSIYKDPNYTSTYYVSFGYSQDELELNHREIDMETHNYTGESLIILSINGKRKELVINQFEALPMLAYP